MEQDIETITVKFREAAGRIFSLIWEDFKRRAERLNRQTDENVFRQLQGRYMEELKMQLTQIAEGLIGQYNGDKNTLNRTCPMK